MTYKQIANAIIAFLLVFMVVVSPVLAADEPKDKITIINNGADDTNNKGSDLSAKSSDNVEDKLISDDKFLGFNVNHNYNVKNDLKLQRGFDLASSLPPWQLLIAGILLLFVLVLAVSVIVILWNLYKGGRAATNENPVKAAQGIKDSKMVTREYMKQVAEGVGAICIIGFFVLLFV